jgi:23S rRNA (guanine1835-N2)-methyltransferase
MQVPQGDFALAPYPAQTNKGLRAWDAADEFLLRHIAAEMPDINAEVLIVNDSAGALSTALAGHRPAMLSDSYLAQVATSKNLVQNGLDASAVRQLGSFDPLPPSIDIVVIKIPKSLALLEDQLFRIAPHIHEKTVVLAGAMPRHIHAQRSSSLQTSSGQPGHRLPREKLDSSFAPPIVLSNARRIHGQRLTWLGATL